MKKLSDRAVPSERGYLSGQITVFFSLILVLIMSLLGTVTELARTTLLDAYAMDMSLMGMDSIFAEYHRELLEKYDVFYLDGGYGGKEFSESRILQRLQSAISWNLEPAAGRPFLRSADMWRLRLEETGCGEFVLATDAGGAGFYRQCVEYKKGTSGLALFADILSRITDWTQSQNLGGIEEDYADAQKKQADDWKKAAEEQEKAASGDKVPVAEDGEIQSDIPENPVQAVEELRMLSPLQIVLADPNEVSRSRADMQQFPSHRKLRKGGGGTDPEANILTDIIFSEYLLEKLPDYTDGGEEDCLNYAVEYVLAGKESDIQNLEYVVNRLLVIREALNFLYLQKDVQKQEEAYALAATLAGITGFPPLIEAAKIGILMTWAFQESTKDVRFLLEGKKVPLMKTAATWNQESDQGITYQDYLRLLLLAQKREKKTMRTLDLIENRIRLLEGCPDFRIDNCVESMRIHLKFSAPRIFLYFGIPGKGQERNYITIDRTYGYGM